MLSTLLFAAALYQASGAKILAEDHKTPAINPAMVDEINAMKTTWTAHISPRFANATIADVKRLLGTILPDEEGYYLPPAKTTGYKEDFVAPESFDVRTNWPACSAITGRVRDQSNCGSCWAFGSTEAFNDRYCIKTGDAKTVFSAEDTNACCSGLQCSFSMGCNGGQPAGAWKWFTEHGVSSGGDWADMNTGATCKPYSMQSCAHHVTPPPGMVACDTLPSYDTPKCTSTCSDAGYGTAYSADKHKASSHYSVSSVAHMQQELMEKGTLSVAMTVYEDFEAYAGGIYQHKTGKSLGGHAIKLVGWGTENGTPYWICGNSWNPSWGEGGYFRIKRGNNECGIEGSVVAGDV